MTFQQTLIVGNVGRDPEFSYTPQGIAVCKFSVAVNKVTGRGENRKEKTTWFRVTVWRERAETASQYIRKGMKIMVIGEVDASAYISKQSGQPMASLELTASDFKFLDSRVGQTDEYEASQGEPGGEPDEERADDLPF